MRTEDRLVAGEPAVPGLPLLLDDDALTGWLRGVLGPAAVPFVARRPYLRWKPGAGGVARVDLGTGAGELFLAVAHRGAAAKLRKTVQRAGDEVVALDPDRLALLGRPGADRDLPGLVRLHRRGPTSVLRRLQAVDPAAHDRLRAAAAGPGPTTLAWKPQRRWVGRVGGPEQAVVMRAYRPGVVGRARSGHLVAARHLGDAVPRLLGADLERGLLAVEHLPGRTLDRSPGGAGADDAAELGRLLARLHGGGSPGRTSDGAGPAGHRSRPGQEALAVRAAGDLLDLLRPDVGAGELARGLAERLVAAPGEPVVPVHGDLSADQVLRRPDGRLALIDLDEAGRGPAALDLGAVAAAWWLAHPAAAASLVAALHDGYAEVADPPEEAGVRLRTAAQLLRRAAEPFRAGRSCWAEQVGAAVEAARDHAAGRDAVRVVP